METKSSNPTIITVKLMRSDPSSPWGFRLQGGRDFSMDLTIAKVNIGSLAERGGLQIGDHLVKINQQPTDAMYHQDAQSAIMRAGNNLDLVIHRGPCSIWRPNVTPVGPSVPYPSQQNTIETNKSTPIYIKTSLAHESSGESMKNIGHAHNKTPRPFNETSRAQQQQNDMNSNLVHMQYNSPMKLYSMDNIRETLEAHSELLAPGVKGINFMKPDTPVNTESEVYKLVMQEERAANKRSLTNRSASCERTTNRSVSQNNQQFDDNIDRSKLSRSLTQAPTTIHGHQQLTYGQQQPQKTPICYECGQRIVGAFARISVNKSLHPECLKCTTCGSSLKNIGHFIVNDKLYCDIHAKQVSLVDQHSMGSTGTRPVLSTPIQLSSSNNRETSWSSSMMKQQSLTTTKASSELLPRALTSPSSDSRSQWAETNHLNTNVGLQRNRELSSLKDHNESLALSAPSCCYCHTIIHGPYVLAGQSNWCKPCSTNHFNCASCHRSLLNVGFVPDNVAHNIYHCEQCYEHYHAPICAKCHIRVKGDCVTALDKQWHPSCLVCQHCKGPLGDSSFHLEDGAPYCERDWNQLFTTKCSICSLPIEAGDKWIEAMNQNYHARCFTCTICRARLEGVNFYCKNGKPYCHLHSR